MQYLFIRFFKKNEIELLEFVKSKFSFSVKEDDYIFLANENVQFIQEPELFAYRGHFRYSNNSFETSKKEFMNRIGNQTNRHFGEDFHGNISGFINFEEKTSIFNDAVGINQLYYYKTDDFIAVSSNLTSIYDLLKPKVYWAGLVMESTKFYNFGTYTPLKNVRRLKPGQILEYNKKGVLINENIDLSIKQKDAKPEDDFANELVALINRESSFLFNNSVNISLSGGIDSRINLAPLLRNHNNIAATNYGKNNLIDTKIPARISKKYNFELDIIDPTPNLFPKKEIVYDIIEKTDSLYINMWHSHILNKNNKCQEIFLLGDILDILRSKRINSLKSRSYRTKYFLKKFFLNSDLKLQTISTKALSNFKETKRIELKDKFENALVLFNLDDKVKEKARKDILDELEFYFNDLDRFNCKSVESYEELFNLFSGGRIEMGKQLNLLHYNFKTQIPLANLQILRKVLNISPKYRYADELTTKMFKTKSWSDLGKFPTSQNPFFAYNSNYFLMLLGWFIRSKSDFFLTKLFVKTKGKTKIKRLFNTFDFHKSYNFKDAESNFAEYFPSNDIMNCVQIKDEFTKRKHGKSWPLAPMDLMPYVQAMYYVDKFIINGDKNVS